MKHLMLMLLAVGLTTSVFSQETKQVLIKEGTSTYEVTEPVYETVTRDIKPNTVNFSNKSENKAILVKERSFYYKITAPVYETVVVDVQKADGTATKVIKKREFWINQTHKILTIAFSNSSFSIFGI